MPLLLIPLAVLALVLLALLLTPLTLWQRYRRGHARRRAVGWALRTNAWLLTVSALVFVLSAWTLGLWVDGALPHALIGLGAGVLAGVIGLWLTRFQSEPGGLYYEPNRWLVLALTLLVAARLGYGLWRSAQLARGGVATDVMIAQQAGLIAVGGVLLGYYLAYTWGVARRCARHRRLPGN